MPKLRLTPGLSKDDLECVMLDLPIFDVVGALGDAFNPDDLYYSDDDQWVSGLVGDSIPHVTLLYGIHPSPDYEIKVLSLLEGWEPPTIFLEEAMVFESEDYYCVVMKVQKTGLLISANKRLCELDYTNDYPDYTPHVTMAYIKKTADKDLWIAKLTEAFSKKAITPYGLNLGH